MGNLDCYLKFSEPTSVVIPTDVLSLIIFYCCWFVGTTWVFVSLFVCLFCFVFVVVVVVVVCFFLGGCFVLLVFVVVVVVVFCLGFFKMYMIVALRIPQPPPPLILSAGWQAL